MGLLTYSTKCPKCACQLVWKEQLIAFGKYMATAFRCDNRQCNAMWVEPYEIAYEISNGKK